MAEREQEREKQNKAIEEYNRMLDEQDKKRAAEWAEREQRIQNAMGRMAETVGKRNEEQQRAEDQRFMLQEQEKDRKAAEREKQKKEEAFKRETEVR